MIDTSVLVDVLREYPPALAWLGEQSYLGLSQYVVLEALDGVRNKSHPRALFRCVGGFAVIPTSAQDAEWAIQSFAKLGLRYGMDGFDCLIAATAYRLQIRLYTRNLKHFAPLLADLAQLPY